MNDLTTIPASQARSNFYQLLNQVADKYQHISISVRGKKQAVIIPNEEYQALIATVETLTNKQIMKDLRQAEQEKQQNHLLTEDEANQQIGW